MQYTPLPDSTGNSLGPVLDWLVAAAGRNGLEEIATLQQHLAHLPTRLPTHPQSLKLLELLHDLTVGQSHALKLRLSEEKLPLSRETRQLARTLQDALESLVQALLTTSPGEEAAGSDAPLSTPDVLWRTARCLALHLEVSHLAATPPGAGIWQQLHSAFHTAMTRGPGPADQPGNGIGGIYAASLLMAAAQPAGFAPPQLKFAVEYIAGCTGLVEFFQEFPKERNGVFWIDPGQDLPPQAYSRRKPPSGSKVLYFACDVAAGKARGHLAALESGGPSSAPGLPAFAQTPGGRSVLKRLGQEWGQPTRRRHLRRRQSGRADLCSGFERLRQLLGGPGQAAETSEWMVINQSPDGYAVMHVAGPVESLQAGDLVALRPRRRPGAAGEAWQVCVIRWALSENPEHLELGLQTLANHGHPACLVQPESPATGRQPAILLPEAPPLRPHRSLAVPAGTITTLPRSLIVVVEQGNLAVHELRASRQEEQTASIEIFSVESDDTP